MMSMILRRRLRNKTKTNRRRKFWVRPLFRATEEKGEFNIYNEFRLHDREYFFRSFRMQPERFDDLHLLQLFIKFREKIQSFEKL